MSKPNSESKLPIYITAICTIYQICTQFTFFVVHGTKVAEDGFWFTNHNWSIGRFNEVSTYLILELVSELLIKT